MEMLLVSGIRQKGGFEVVLGEIGSRRKKGKKSGVCRELVLGKTGSEGQKKGVWGGGCVSTRKNGCIRGKQAETG